MLRLKLKKQTDALWAPLPDIAREISNQLYENNLQRSHSTHEHLIFTRYLMQSTSPQAYLLFKTIIILESKCYIYYGGLYLQKLSFRWGSSDT